MSRLRNIYRATETVTFASVNSTALVLWATSKSLKTGSIPTLPGTLPPVTLASVVSGYALTKAAWGFLHGISWIEGGLKSSSGPKPKYLGLGILRLILSASLADAGIENLMGVNGLGIPDYLGIYTRLAGNAWFECYEVYCRLRDNRHFLDVNPQGLSYIQVDLAAKTFEAVGWTFIAILGVSNPLGWACLAGAMLAYLHRDVYQPIRNKYAPPAPEPSVDEDDDLDDSASAQSQTTRKSKLPAASSRFQQQPRQTSATERFAAASGSKLRKQR